MPPTLNQLYKLYLEDPDDYKEKLGEALLRFVKRWVESEARMRGLADSAIEDVIGDTLLRVWEKLPELTNHDNLEAYVTESTRTNVNYYLREERKWRKTDYPPGLMTGERSPLLGMLLQEAKEQLSPADRQLLQLELEGFTDAEIAEQLGLAVKTVANRLSLIRKRLKEFAGSLSLSCIE